ncbi:MAG: redoxin domain-containing protein [Muribaculaceae bacterium]|nr:redoxin domain-containing protein [Muribaculaceae bacterium]
MKLQHILAVLTLLSAGLSACSDPTFKVTGEIEEADGGHVVLEKADHAGYWIAIDSASVNASGRFTIKSHAPSAPEIYRLKYNDGYVYIPIDSVETIHLSAPASNFATDYRLSGSENAENMERFEKELISFTPHANNPDSVTAFKRHIYSHYLQGSNGSIVSYYILTKVVDDKPLFGDAADDKYFAAVATAFRQYRPDDPRTALLESVATRLRRERNTNNGRRKVIQAAEARLVDIELTDEDGNTIKLSDYAVGKPTLLMFCQLTDPETPAINAKLRTRADRGAFKVYQVGMDADRLQWRNSAKNLPWATLFGGAPEDVARIAQSYMVAQLPAYFIIDANGNLTSRAATLNEALDKLP